MAEIPVSKATAVPLNLQLGPGDEGKYVRAFLRDTNGGNISGSPVDLVERGLGLYTSTAFVMPDLPFLLAVYKVYDDAGYTVKSPTHSDEIDLFYQPAEVQLNTDRLDHITGVIRLAPNLSAMIDSSNSKQIRASLGRAGVAGEIRSSENLGGAVRSTSLRGVLEK